MYVAEFLFKRWHEYSLQPTVDLKTPVQKEKFLKFQKFLKNTCKNLLFTEVAGLQPRTSDYNQKRPQE